MNEHEVEAELEDLREVIDNAYEWLYIIMNRLDQIEDPGSEPKWPVRQPILPPTVGLSDQV